MPAIPMRRITSYKDFCRTRGIIDSGRILSRPYRFDFENNEDEERAIAEAIAREEELMRQEEADKGGRPEPGARDPAGRPYDEDPEEHARMLLSSTHFGYSLYSHPALSRYTPNLTIHKDDSADTRVVKQTLETMVMQVCRWDKQFGWFKNLLLKPKRPHLERRRMFANQREAILAEHIDRLRKEINKRRTKLENQAEELCGLPTPWRKSRMKSHLRVDEDWQDFGYLLDAEKDPPIQIDAARGHSATKTAEINRPRPVAINPAEISLGGDVVDNWIKEEKPIDIKEEAKNEVKLDEDVKKEVQEETLESNTVADWEPSRRGPALPSPPKHKRRHELEDTSSSGSEVRRRGRPPKRYHKEHMSTRSSEDYSFDKSPPQGLDPNLLHCICRTTYNPRRFYLPCEMCFRWFHGRCVGVKEDTYREMDGWTCRECLQEAKKARQQQELYCVCRTPYNDTEFYVGCESCEGWFHPRCVGITKEEAEAMDEYVCPNCAEAQTAQGYESASSAASSTHATLCRADYPLVWRLLETIADHRMSWPFRQPVDPEEFPNYNEVIEHPIDLSVIQRRLENLEYQRLKDFTRDMTQLFENARLFYPRDSNVYQCADTLEKIFEHALVDIRNEIEARISGRKVSESQTIDSSLDIDTDQLIDVNLDVDPTMFLL